MTEPEPRQHKPEPPGWLADLERIAMVTATYCVVCHRPLRLVWRPASKVRPYYRHVTP